MRPLVVRESALLREEALSDTVGRSCFTCGSAEPIDIVTTEA